MRDAGRFVRWTLALAVVVVAVTGVVEGATRPRAVLVLPFDASALGPEEQWVGEGVAQLVSLGLAQHPAFVQIDTRRRRAAGHPEVWGEPAVVQAARALRVDAALFGRVTRANAEYVVQPKLIELKAAPTEPVALEPITSGESDLLARLAPLAVAYARTLKVALSESEVARMEKAAQPTRSLKAFELFARGELAVSRQPGQEGNEQAVDLLARAIEADPNFAVAYYRQGVVHQELGNRWKASSQFRAAMNLDPTYPEPDKALGDLYMAAPRRVLDQAVESYSKAIELRPFYADAYVGLGDAKAARSDVDGAIAAYNKALGYNPINPKVHISLGKIYYAEKGLYYESVNAYKKAIELDPSSVDARMGLGEVYEDKGLYKEALDEYRRVTELDGKYPEAMYNLASVYEKVDPKEAVTQWERYISLASELPSQKDWVDVARQHLRKLKAQLKD